MQAIDYELENISVESLAELSQKKIYIGHGSVGYNIIRGLEDLTARYPEINLDICDPREVSGVNNCGIIHSFISQKGTPQEIIDDFSHLIENVVKEKVDFIFLRFTPFYGQENIVENFNDYKSAVEELKRRYPESTVIHGTFPLSYSPITWKTTIKEFIGKKEIWEYADNIKINEFNRLLRKEYGGKEPIFDIAKIQSTYPNKKRCTFSSKGNTYYHMVPYYTNDKFHLNETGRKLIAIELLNTVLKNSQFSLNKE